jgi:hypothetical protein
MNEQSEVGMTVWTEQRATWPAECGRQLVENWESHSQAQALMFQDPCDLSLSIIQFHVKNDTDARLIGDTSHTGDDKAFMYMHPNLTIQAAEFANGECRKVHGLFILDFLPNKVHAAGSGRLIVTLLKGGRGVATQYNIGIPKDRYISTEVKVAFHLGIIGMPYKPG